MKRTKARTKRNRAAKLEAEGAAKQLELFRYQSAVEQSNPKEE
jgi:hypothetical protein